ncbi:MAG: hypothetical protein ABIQ53_00675 [Terracoccus sp.]
MPVHHNPETALPEVCSAAVPTRDGHTGPIAGLVAVETAVAAGRS